MREIIIAGNWKMNTLPWEGVALAHNLSQVNDQFATPQVVVAPPATHLFLIQNVLRDSRISVASQNVHWADSGAFTGEISTGMLTSLGIKWVIIGHSERRQYFGETDSTVNKRAHAAINAGLRPIICVGESLADRDSGKTFDVLKRQLSIGFEGLPMTGVGGVVIAYEPIWAIGTGRTATSAQAEEAHIQIRSEIAAMFGELAANTTVIQYGGSVNEINAEELLSCPNVDGALVGGASLSELKFNAIIEAGRRKSSAI